MHSAHLDPEIRHGEAQRIVFSISCADCEDTLFMPKPVLPEGWKVGDVHGTDQLAYCPACARNLPETAQ